VILPKFYLFAVIGFLSTIVDWGTYALLLPVFPRDICKGISYIVGSTCSFFGNERFNFKSSGSKLIFALIYCISFIINIALNKIMVIYLDYSLLLSLFLTTTFTFLVNFTLVNSFAFKEKIAK